MERDALNPTIEEYAGSPITMEAIGDSPSESGPVVEATRGIPNPKSQSPWKRNNAVEENAPGLDVVNGVASILIPEEIFEEADLLWKSYVVGYFIGDAPHVGSIHATVNRIWTSSKSYSKIDVQFIEKNTVLFH